MAKKLNGVLGVDIGSRTIKVAEIKSQGKEPLVTGLAIVDTPEGAVDHTGIFNPDAVAVAIKQAAAAAGASTSNVVVTIAGQASVLVRTLEVPRMNATELREHMAWEINRNIPFAESNVVSDYRPLADEDPNSANMDVVMAISPQSAIDTLIACIKGAKKVPVAIDVEPLSMARSVTFSYGDEFMGQTVCVVDMGHKTTAINIYKDGKLLMPRQIPFGGEMITKALADGLALPLEEAEQIKFERCEIPLSVGVDTGSMTPFDPGGFGGAPTLSGNAEEFQPYNPFADDQYAAPAPAEPESSLAEPPVAATVEVTEADSPFGEAGDSPFAPTLEPTPAYDATPAVSEDPEALRYYGIMAPVLEEFVAEVRRSVDYFRSRGGEIDRILLAGGSSRMKGLSEFVSRGLMGMPCDGYDCFRRLNLNSKKVAVGLAEEHRQDFSVAIGNGLHIFVD